MHKVARWMGDSKQRAQHLPDGFREDGLAFGGGVDAVALVKARVAADAGEEEGDEGKLVFVGEGRIHRGEGAGVVLAHARGYLHAGEEDLGGGIFRADAVDDGLEVFLRDGGLDAAKAVVAAEREHEDVDGLAQDPVDAAAPARGGLAAEAGIDDAPRQMFSGDFFADERGVGVFVGIIEAQAGGQAVTEKHDGAHRRGLRGAEVACGKHGSQQEQTDEETEKGDVHGANRPLKLAFVPFRRLCASFLP